MQNLKVK